VRTLALGAALFGGNVIASNFTSRVDLTSEGLYSLSAATEKVVSEMKGDRPVLIQAFVSPQVPREYVPIRSTLIGLLRQLDQLGGDKVRVRIVQTEKFSDQAEEARRYGITPVETQSERGGRFVVDDVFLGAVFTSGADEEVVLPFINVGTPIEYELMRSLRTVSLAKRRTLGVLRGDAKVMGGFDMQSFRSTPEWRIVTELKKQYEVKEVGPDELGKEPLDALLALMPSSLTEPEMQKFVAYVESGAATLIVDDPFVMSNPSLSPRQPKPRAGGNPMFGGGPPPEAKADNGEARALTNLLEIAWNSGASVWDFYDPHPELSQILQRFNVVYVGQNSGGSRPFSIDSEITKGLQEVMFLYPGEIRPRKDSLLKFTALLRTSPKSAIVEWDDYTTSAGFMGGIAPKSPERIEIPEKPVEYVLAAKITGAKKSVSASLSGAEDVRKGKELNVIYVADLDMISDTFFQIRDQKWQDLNLDNVTFILNCVDDLVGDDTFIDLRKRRPKHRTLETIEQEATKFKVAFNEASKKASIEAAEKLKEAQKSLADEVKKISDDASMDEQTKMIRLKAAQENERRRLEVKTFEIQNDRAKKIKQEEAVKERSVRSIEAWWRWLACLISPIPALIVGIFVFASRVQTERQGIAADRQVKQR
jgi:ABC-2 type transport system permease protein